MNSRPKRAAARGSRKLTAAALEQLGAPRLAALLIAQSEADPLLARSLRFELAGADGATHLAAEIEKRLRTIQRSRGFVEWDKVRPLAREIDNLREAIAGPLAAASPRIAAELMRQLLGLAEGIFERSDDGSGTLGEAFREVGAAKGLIFRPPFLAPAACWWARMMVLSTIRYSKSGSSDMASKMRRHTPLSLQRLKRRNTLFQSPNTSGRSRHGEPVRTIHNTPSTNMRLSRPVEPF